MFCLGAALLKLLLPAYFKAHPSAAQRRDQDPTLHAFCQALGRPGVRSVLPQSADRLLGPALVHALNTMLHEDPSQRAHAWDVVQQPLFRAAYSELWQATEADLQRRGVVPAEGRRLPPADPSQQLPHPLPTVVLNPPTLLAYEEGGSRYLRQQLRDARGFWNLATCTAEASARQAQEVRRRRPAAQRGGGVHSEPCTLSTTHQPNTHCHMRCRPWCTTSS